MKCDRRGFFKAAGLASSAVLASAAMSRPAQAKRLNDPYPIPEGPLTADDWRALKAKAAEIYELNRETLAAGTFHVPAHGKYDSLFGWDSGWHAIAMSRIDPAIAASELETLTSLQLDNGRISHDTHFPELQKESNWFSKLGTKMGESQFDERGRSAMIDPPSYMIAAGRVFDAGRGRVWLERVLPRLTRCADYLARGRALLGDGLVAVIHPWETGTDSSPAYDKILHLNFRTPLGAPKRGLLYHRMIDYNSEFGWDPQIAKERNRFVLEDVCFNAITIRGLQELARLHEVLGNQEQARTLQERARGMMAALDRVCWVEGDGLYQHRYDSMNPRLTDRTTASCLLPLMTGLVSHERAQRLIHEHVLNPEEFWLEYLFPFNAKDEMEGDKVYMEDLLLWRGHCIWTNMNWMIHEGLRQYGYEEEARELTRRTARMIEHEGLWEFYDFRNGQGKGQPNFNWPGVVLDMIAVSWPEAVAPAA
jgi:glycogen debranching enzyme